MRRKVFLMQSASFQGTVRRMARELGEGFTALGFEACGFEVDDAVSLGRLQGALLADEVLIIISMNQYSELIYQAAAFCTQRRVPVFFYNFDQPGYGFEEYTRLLDALPDLTISLTGSDEVAAAECLLGRGRNFAVLRQAVAEAPAVDATARDLGGLFIGNNLKIKSDITSPDLVRAGWAEHGPKIAAGLNAMAEIHQAHPLLPLYELARQGTPPSITGVRMLADMMGMFDLYMRGKVRADAITVLADLDVTICGEGWDYLQAPGQKARFLGSTPNDVCRELMGRANVLFNIVPEYYSCSERVLEAAMTGCPVITTRSRFFEQEFGDALLFYTDPAQLPERMEMAADRAFMVGRIDRARAVVLERHTWTHRAQAILDILAERGFPLS